MVQKVKANDKTEVNGDHEGYHDYVGSGDNHSMGFDLKDVIDVAVEGVTFDNREKLLNGMCGVCLLFLLDAECFRPRSRVLYGL